VKNKGFTLIELLVVISIIGLLAAVLLTALVSAKDAAYLNRTKVEFRSIETALEMYRMDHNNQYPDDVARDTMPTGLSAYIGANWPKGPWPGSYYDWDNWNIGGPIYQISLRFCPAGGNLATCHFPKEPWASSFGVDSSVYYCITGACRAHESEPIDYPGYCANCH
jgi:type II secretion system protein G